jgi:nitrite reductase/ring-hydroxylating ferredoxin subunit
MTYDEKRLARRQVLGVGVAGAALAIIPEACGSGSGGPGDASSDMKSGMDTGPACTAADYSRQVNITDAKIAKPGTSYEFSDNCYSDPFCMQDRIILVHPVTKNAYIAMSGSCTHECCDNVDGTGGPKYYASFVVTEEAGVPEGGEEAGSDATVHEGGAHEAGSLESGALEGGPHEGGGLESGLPEGGDHDAGIHDAGVADGEEEGGVTYQDVLYCDCHGSIFNALNGHVIRGPAGTPLQILKTSQSGGVVVITIPKNS